MQDNRRFYVYVHRRKSDGQIFYVGKGIKGREISKVSRSGFWHNIVSRHGFVSQQCLGPVPEPCSFTFEKMLIHALGMETLCNLSMGGDGGVSGYKFKRDVVLRKSQKCMKPVINSAGEVFPSLKSAAQRMRDTGHQKATESHISSCCNGTRHIAYGLSWSFNTNEVPRLIDAASKVNEKRLIAVRASNGVAFPSVSSAAKWVRSELGVKSGTSTISKCCNGSRRTCAGLKWEYIT